MEGVSGFAIEEQPLAKAGPDLYGGRGLFSTDPISKGSTIISVPASKLVCAPEHLSNDNILIDRITEKLCPSTENSGTAQQNIWWLIVALACWRVDETLVDSVVVSDHAQDLPWESAHWQLPILWSPDILEDALSRALLLETDDSSVNAAKNACDNVRSRVQMLQNSAAKLNQVVCEELKQHETVDSVVLTCCQEAVALVMSRTLCLPESGRMALVSDVDLANHSDRPNAVFEEDGGGRKSSPVRLVALRDITEGEVITISYGVDKAGKDKSDEIFFAGYGFVPTDDGTTNEGRVLSAAIVHGQEAARRQ